MKKYVVAALCMAWLYPVVAQPTEVILENPGHLTCKTHSHDEEILRKNGIDPTTNPQFLAYEQWCQEYTPTQRGGIFIIPVVFHIVHAGGAENISDAQVMDALAILNRDFRRLNADTSVVVAAFKPIIADCEIEFRLAQRDAQGNCVKGITRTYSTETFIGTTDMVDAVNLNLNAGASTNNTRFPRDKYLNIWICANPDGAAGYTNTPFGASFGPAKYDGIWISHQYFGSIGTSSPGTSRALTHEVGHWLNLSHCWGSTNNPGVSCGTDNVNDTPETMGWTSCNLSGATCGSPLDNVQNYMEYSYCSRMFTNGQKSRMHAALNSTIAQRNNLWQPSNLSLTGTAGVNYLCAADFSSDKIIICQGDSIAFEDQSYHAVNGWTWTFTGGNPSSSSVQNPVITYSTPGTYPVSLTSTDGSSNVSTTKVGYVTVLPSTGSALPYSENFESMTSFPNSTLFLENADGQQAWQLFTGAGSSGNKCLKLNNFSNLNDGTKDAFVSSTIDLSGLTTVNFYFWAAYSKKVAANADLLRVYISNTCGDNWVVKKNISSTAMTTAGPMATAFTPNSTQWLLHSVTGISATYLTSDFRFKIELQSDLGNNVYIDDINIQGPVGQNELSQSGYSFVLLPNPAETEVAVSLTAPGSDAVTIELTDMAGRVVFENKNVNVTSGINTFYVPVEALSTGMYMVHVFSGNMHMTQKLVKK